MRNIGFGGAGSQDCTLPLPLFLMLILLAGAVTFVVPPAAFPQQPAPGKPPSSSLTAEQQEKLKRADVLRERAVKLVEAGKPREALPLAEEALRLRREILGEGHIDCARGLCNLAKIYKSMGQHARAESLLLKARDDYARVFGEKHLEYARLMHNLGDLYLTTGRYKEAQKLLIEADGILQKSKDHRSYAANLNSLGILYKHTGLYDKAEESLLEAHRITREVFGDQRPEYAVSANNLASFYEALGKYAKAESLYLQACEIQKKTLGEDHPDYASTLNNLGNLYHKMGESKKAEQLLLHACDIQRRSLDDQHPNYADSLNNLGLLYKDMGEYAKAEALLLQGHAIDEKVLRKQDPLYVAGLNNLASLYEAMGQYQRARKLYVQCWKTCKALGERHPYYHASLKNLAWCYRTMGEYDEAERLFLRVLEIQKNMLDEHHPGYADTLSSLGGLYELMGEYAKAEPLYRKACAIYREIRNGDNAGYASALGNLAGLYSTMGKYAEAETLSLQACEIQKRLWGPHHPEYATALNNLATLYSFNGQYSKAEPLYLQAHEIKRQIVGERHPDFAVSLNNLACLYQSIGQYEKAEPYYTQARDIRRETLGEQHPLYASSLYGLASLYFLTGPPAKAVEFAQRAANTKRAAAVAMFSAFSEAQALNYAAKALQSPDLLLSSSRHADVSTDDIYACLWAQRGLVYRITAQRLQQLRATNNPDIRGLLGTYQDTRRMLGGLILSSAGSTPEQAAAKRKRIGELTQEKERLERQLAGKLPEFRRQLEAERRTPTDLAASLPPDAAFVDFLRYRYIEQDPKIRGRAGERKTDSYVAFIVRHGKPTERVELGPAATINKALARWHDEIMGNGVTSPWAAELRRLLWEPVERHFPTGTKTVYLCPDDRLTSLPWIALPGHEAGTVVLEEYSLATVPYGQFLLEELIAPRTPEQREGVLLAVGGVAYDNRPVEVPWESETLAMRSAAIDKKHASWPALAGTKRELEEVTRSAGARATVRLDGQRASSTAVLKELPRARWAHFATHGFFADPKFRSALQVDEQIFGQRQGGERQTPGARNPLVLSGLVFAGANLPRPRDEYGIPEGDGGIVTAEAIAALPLGKLELAVLSACDSGVGEVAAGEGVFGLQRAFHLAGAQNVVASLWKVDDDATDLLMELFYRNLWEERMPPLEALRQAQLAVYRHPERIEQAASRGRPSGSTASASPVASGPTRGPAPGGPVELPGGMRARSRVVHAATRQWAAFVLSGAGR